MPNVEIDVWGLGSQFRTEAGVTTARLSIDLRIDQGETLCPVGESGFGKTVPAHSAMPASGDVAAGQRLFRRQGDVCSIEPTPRPVVLGQI